MEKSKSEFRDSLVKSFRAKEANYDRQVQMLTGGSMRE